MNNQVQGSGVTMLKKLIVAVFIAVGATISFSGSTEGQAAQAGSTKIQSSSARTDSRERFDFLVRSDFFAGFAGDQAALERGMKVCEETLAQKPNHAEALVWHGGGLMFIAGQAFQRTDFRKGAELWDRGLKEMDRAVELEPNNVGVLIPRGAALLQASRFIQDKASQRSLLEKGVGDHEKVLELQKAYFNKLSSHSRGELLFGLAEGSVRLGNTDKARAYFLRIANECKDSIREKQANAWLEKGVLPATGAMSCSGCHTK